MIDGLADGKHQLRLVVETGVVGIDAFSASAILPAGRADGDAADHEKRPSRG